LPLSLYFRTHVHWPLMLGIERLALLATSASVIVFYAVCQRDLHSDWKFRIRHLPAMISIGVGMCISNAKAVLQGMMGHRFEFHRTPKYSVAAHDQSWKKNLPLGKFIRAVTEVAFAGYFLVATGVACSARQWASLPFIALSVRYTYVALLTAMHGRLGTRFIPALIETEGLRTCPSSPAVSGWGMTEGLFFVSGVGIGCFPKGHGGDGRRFCWAIL